VEKVIHALFPLRPTGETPRVSPAGTRRILRRHANPISSERALEKPRDVSSESHAVTDTVPVTVIVVNWNGGDDLARCLTCLAAQESLPERVVVVDNGSTDGSADAVERLVAADTRLALRTVFQRAGRNLGFAAANNLAVQACGTEFIALLNPDAFPEPGWLAALVDAARSHPRAAAFGSLQLLDGGDGLIDGIGDVYHVSGLSWRAGHGRPRTPAADEDHEIFSACAAAALYRRDAFLAAGGFDEDFFCYFEDVDLGFRLRLAGWQARHVSAAVVRHAAGRSCRNAPADFALFHGHRNLVWCFAKNMPGPLLAGLLIPHLLQTIVAMAFFSTRGQGRPIVKAKGQAMAGLPRMWRKRRAVQASRTASCRDIWRVLDTSFARGRGDQAGGGR
jgi:GT2 family glycosyltransferase